tara:strand:- start:1935 stop:3140 length:1206 start_codon:yes stop_codon:yes gene_type:complete
MKKLLIIETEYEGHYLTGYIKYILRALKGKKIKIFLLISEKTIKYGKGALKILTDEGVSYNIETFKTPTVNKTNFISLTIYQLKLYFLVKRKFNQINRKNNFDHVIFTSIQRLDKIISIFGSPFNKTKFSGVFLGLKFHLGKLNIKSTSTNHFLSEYLFKRLLNIRTFSKVIVNDYLLKKYIFKKKWKKKNKVLFLHDPKEFNFIFKKNYSLNKLGIPKNKFVILVYGAIINSKGVMELLKIYTNKSSKNIHCLIVGKQIGSTKKFLYRNKFIKKLINNKQISIYDNWQTEKKEALFFHASDAIWIGYKNYPFPSGVLYQAVSLKKPSLISNEGFINELNKKHKIGISIDIYNPKSILDGVKKLKNSKNKSFLTKSLSTFSKISDPRIWAKTFKNTFEKII